MDFLEIEWNSNLYRQEIELRDRLLRAPLGLTFTSEELEEESAEFHFVLVENGEVCACAVIVPVCNDEVKLRQMAVTEHRQRQGLGTNLIRQIESTLVKRGIQKIQLNAREKAIPFYQRLGYQTAGDPFIEVGITHWQMYHHLLDC